MAKKPAKKAAGTKQPKKVDGVAQKPKKAPKAKVLKNHVAIILDRSGSMESIRDSTIKAFNEQVQSIRVASRGQQTDISLFTFSNGPDEPKFFAAPVEGLVELTRETYAPDGGTALYDSILETTRRLGNLKDANEPETSFLIVIISDGDENASRATGEDVQKRLAALDATKRWTFTYVGCSVADMTKMRNIGISTSNSRSFTATAAGVAGSSTLNSTSTACYFTARASGSTQVNNLYDQAEAALGVVTTADGSISVSIPGNVTLTSALPPTSTGLILPPGVTPPVDPNPPTNPPTTT